MLTRLFLAPSCQERTGAHPRRGSSGSAAKPSRPPSAPLQQSRQAVPKPQPRTSAESESRLPSLPSSGTARFKAVVNNYFLALHTFQMWLENNNNNSCLGFPSTPIQVSGFNPMQRRGRPQAGKSRFLSSGQRCMHRESLQPSSQTPTVALQTRVSGCRM